MDAKYGSAVRKCYGHGCGGAEKPLSRFPAQYLAYERFPRSSHEYGTSDGSEFREPAQYLQVPGDAFAESYSRIDNNPFPCYGRRFGPCHRLTQHPEYFGNYGGVLR